MVSLSATPIITENAIQVFQTVMVATHPYTFIPGISIPTGTVEDELETEDDRHEPHLIFPMAIPHAYQIPFYHEPQYADHWPIGFLGTHRWTDVWHGQECNIEPYLHMHRNIKTGVLAPWTLETKFKGARWRLTISKNRDLSNMPNFREGMIISFRHCNNANFRYIIDHCVFEDELRAYLKVLCFRIDHHVCDIWTPRPPIILEIPIVHCNVRDHPNRANFNALRAPAFQVHTNSAKKPKTMRNFIRSVFEKI